MDAVRDVRDRHLVRGRVAEERAPHLARDLAVTHAHRVRAAREAQGERRHARPLVASRMGPAEVEEPCRVDAHARRQVGERLEERRRLVRLVPGRHGGVGREDAAVARRGERVVGRRARRHLLGRELERGEGGVALVEVQHAGLDPERAERAHRAEAEQPVLAEARERVPLVEPGGDPPVERVVLLELGVEEVERDAPDLRPPDVERDLAAEERERERERAAVLVAHLNRRKPLGHDLRPVLVLQPRPVDALLEVPLAVEQPDPDHRQREVARRLEDVAGERAEPAGVDRQRRVHAELGADEDDRAAEPFDRRLGARAVVLEHLLRAARSARASGRARRRSPPRAASGRRAGAPGCGHGAPRRAGRARGTARPRPGPTTSGSRARSARAARAPAAGATRARRRARPPPALPAAPRCPRSAWCSRAST